MSKPNTSEDQNLDSTFKAAQKAADSLSKEQVQEIIKATKEAELAALTAAQKYYVDLKVKFEGNIAHNAPIPQKLNDVNSILTSIAITQKTVLSDGVSLERYQTLMQNNEKLKNKSNSEEDAAISTAAKHWENIAAAKNDDRSSALSLASDHVMSIAKYSANTVPAAYNFARAVAEYMVMTVVVDSVTKGFDHLAQIYKKGKQYSDVTRAKFGSAYISPVDDFDQQNKDLKTSANIERTKEQLSKEMDKIQGELNMQIEKEDFKNKERDFVFHPIDRAYCLQDYVEKLDKNKRPDLKLLKQYRDEYIKAHDSTVLTKVVSTLTGIIASSTQAIMAPIRIALTTTSNIAYTPVGIYKNYQSNKKDDKGNVKNWAKSAATIREELTTRRKDKAQASFARNVQKEKSQSQQR